MSETRLYCRHCGYIHHSNGCGIPQCPRCLRGMHFATGTPEEIEVFVQALEKDPQAYKNFPGGDKAW